MCSNNIPKSQHYYRKTQPLSHTSLHTIPLHSLAFPIKSESARTQTAKSFLLSYLVHYKLYVSVLSSTSFLIRYFFLVSFFNGLYRCSYTVRHTTRAQTPSNVPLQTERISPHHSNAHTHNGRVKIRVSEVLLTLNQHNYAPFRFPRLSTSVSSVVETVVVVFVVLSVCSSLVGEMLENFS